MSASMDTTTPTTGKIHAAMVQVLKKVDAVAKNKKNQQQGFVYRGIDDVYAAIHPCLAEAGIYCRTEALSREQLERTSKSGGTIFSVVMKLRFHFCADDGSSVHVDVFGEGMDNADKATNKATAIGHKYAILQAFCIPTEDLDDGDGTSHEVASRQQAKPSPTPRQPDKSGKSKIVNPKVDAPRLLCGAYILDGEEFSSKEGAAKPWVAWRFTLSHEGTPYSACTFSKDLATTALKLANDQMSQLVDVEIEPGRVEGQLVLTGVQPADDIQT